MNLHELGRQAGQHLLALVDGRVAPGLIRLRYRQMMRNLVYQALV